ncbi:MAG: primosomal protein N' [Alicyclobacillaceae bacterium]|nr:primosomal protein N' [Alicyclobacillaceae bacterium]
MTPRVAAVIVDVRSRSLDRVFHYSVPDALADRLQRGHRVEVPFGRRRCQGYVVDWPAEADRVALDRLRAVERILDDEPLLTDHLLALAEWLRERYVCTHLEAIEAIVPGGVRGEQAVGARTTAVLVAADAAALGLEAERLRARRRAPKRLRLVEALCAQAAVPLDALGLRPSDPAVTALVRDGYARLERREVYRVPQGAALEEPHAGSPPLTVHQERALATIRETLEASSMTGGGSRVVLYGVTGSGKTEVYLRAIEQCLQMGGGAVVLVPEIALTPQMVGRFTARFGRQVAVLHSALSAGEKRDEWLRVRRGEASIVVGARSAVFAPVSNLRLVIVDEEHEPSYKQEESPRYDAREVAHWRVRQTGGVVVYGSATPSLQAMRWVEERQARLVSLPFRVNGRPLPRVTVVDMRQELREGNRTLFSRALCEGLEEAVAGGRQAILFLNRRGFAAFVLCRHCGEVMQCPRCDISLTLHHRRHAEGMAWRLVCHYCQYEAAMPESCPSCGERAMRPFGVGTQQVEQLLRERWPQWRVLRVDVDTTRAKGAHAAAMQQFLRGDADILLGTQMIAKGLDFPNVGFVGVVAADTMLAVPDYRAAERTFNLLTQVAGRAGRADVEGRTVVQTYRPEHYAIAAAAAHDYGAFYRQEREVRRAFHYPPFCELSVFMAMHGEERLARSAAARFEREVGRVLSRDLAVVLPAAPSALARVDNQYRFQVVVKYTQWDAVRPAIVAAYETVSAKMRAVGGRCVLDVNAGRIG